MRAESTGKPSLTAAEAFSNFDNSVALLVGTSCETSRGL